MRSKIQTYQQIEHSIYPFNPTQTATSNKPAYKSSKLYSQRRVTLVEVKGVGSHYIYGPSSQYDTAYPPQLRSYIPQREWESFINEVNERVMKYWPCQFSFILAYACCILSCFMSLLLPKMCIDDVIKFLQYVLERWNENWNPRGIFVDWKRSFCRSYLEISIRDNFLVEEGVSGDLEEQAGVEMVDQGHDQQMAE